MAPRTRLFLILALLGAALALRLAAAVVAPRLGGDSEYYLQLGRGILHHGTLGVPGPDGVPQPTLAREPGYPVFLAMVLALAGSADPAATPVLVGVAQGLLSVLACWLVFLLTERLTGSTGWGLAALAGCAFNPYLIRFSSTVLTETLGGTLLVVAVALLVLPRPRPGPLLGAGMALGALALTRIQWAPLVLLFGAVYLLCAERAARRLAGYAALGFVLVMSTWWVRNYVTFGRIILAKPRFVHADARQTFLPVGYHAWFNMWMEREEDIVLWLWRVDPRVELLPARALQGEEERRAVEALFETMRSRGSGQPVELLLTSREDDAFAELARRRRDAESPLEWGGRTARRFAHLWEDLPVHYSPLRPVLPDAASIRERGMAREARRGAAVLLFLSHYPLSLLALVGCAAVRRDRRWLYAATPLAYVTVVHTLLHALESRCLVLVYPLVIMLAVAGAVEIVSLLRRVRGGPRRPSPAPAQLVAPVGS